MSKSLNGPKSNEMFTARKILIILSFLVFAFSIAGLFRYTTDIENEQSAFRQAQEELRGKAITFHEPCCNSAPHLYFRLGLVVLLGILFLQICFGRNPAWSLPFSIVVFLIYAAMFWGTQQAIAIAENPQMDGLNRYIDGANVFDVLLLPILLSCNVIILQRLIVRSWRSESRMP